MEVSDLKIGDWVNSTDEAFPVVVQAIHNQDDVEVFDGIDNDSWRMKSILDIEPIPISGEILEQNGWKYFGKDNKKLDFHNMEHWLLDKCEAWRLDDNTILNFRIISNDHHTQYVGKIQYVHELQHALRLCGIEKDIAL